MNRIRFFTDEDVYGAIALRLRAGGFDAISTPEAGRAQEKRSPGVFLGRSPHIACSLANGGVGRRGGEGSEDGGREEEVGGGNFEVHPTTRRCRGLVLN
jgi:hypothetical protein